MTHVCSQSDLTDLIYVSLLGRCWRYLRYFFSASFFFFASLAQIPRSVVSMSSNLHRIFISTCRRLACCLVCLFGVEDGLIDRTDVFESVYRCTLYICFGFSL